MQLLSDLFAQGNDRIMVEVQDEESLTCKPNDKCHTEFLADMIEAICQVGELTIRATLDVEGTLLLSKIQDFEVLGNDSFLSTTPIKAKIIGNYKGIYQCQITVMTPKKQLVVKATYATI